MAPTPLQVHRSTAPPLCLARVCTSRVSSDPSSDVSSLLQGTQISSLCLVLIDSIYTFPLVVSASCSRCRYNAIVFVSPTSLLLVCDTELFFICISSSSIKTILR